MLRASHSSAALPAAANRPVLRTPLAPHRDVALLAPGSSSEKKTSASRNQRPHVMHSVGPDLFDLHVADLPKAMAYALDSETVCPVDPSLGAAASGFLPTAENEENEWQHGIRET